MLLTVSKRLEFSASRRLFDPKLTPAENVSRFGQESNARYGTGRNYVVHFVFTGQVNTETGMLMNIGEIKARVGEVLNGGFDHKFLNEDNAAFAHTAPTSDNVARELFRLSAPLFHDSDARLVACHLSESEERSATVYASGACDANYWFEFSAARRTMSPHLGRDENEQLFGTAASPFGHGHNYRARVTLSSDGSQAETGDRNVKCLLQQLRDRLDHKNLNEEVPALQDRPITTELLSSFVYEQLASAGVTPDHVRLHERDDFFAEHWGGDRYFLGMRRSFNAAHRLHASALSDVANTELFGKCNNPRGHGHTYGVEATIGGTLDERSGTLYSFAALDRALNETLKPWNDKHLDLEVSEFRDTASTGENIVSVLWEKVDRALEGRLVRLRLAETANNRFTLRPI
ncbi:MAG: 6-carboxytetrahydropterin synthase [Chthoniobacterales bacterium]|nr:6-carboxytetrahydropterin synthase [Chthoniobacterales bacterium]